jgi:putative endonuclease
MDIFTKNKALSLGARGEEVAANYLRNAGYLILATNFCNVNGRRMGEIDIIAKIKDELVFVEVKTRVKHRYSEIPPEENITRSKLYKLNKAASFYISKNKLYNISYRFDAVTLVVNIANGTAKLRHLKNIFI